MTGVNEAQLEGLSALIIEAQSWKKSVAIILGFGLVMQIPAVINVLAGAVPIFADFSAVLLFVFPALLAFVLTRPLVRLFGKSITWDWSALIALGGLILSIFFGILPTFIFGADYQLFFAISLAFIFMIRIIAIAAIADHRFTRVILPACIQSMAAWVVGTAKFGYYFGTYALILQICFGAGIIVFLWLIERPLKKIFNINPLGLANAFMAYMTEGSKALEDYFSEIGEEAFVPQATLFFRRNGKEDITFTVPNIHPGPLGEIGGSNLPKIIHDSLDGETFVAHGCATHDLNPVAAIEIEKITETIRSSAPQAVFDTKASKAVVLKKPPVSITGQAFGDAVLMISTRAPEITDDIEFPVGLAIMEGGSRHFKNVLFVDGHNSMADIAPAVRSASRKAVEYMRAAQDAVNILSAAPQREFSAGAARVQTPFTREEGFGDLGVQALVIKTEDQTTAYVLIDGNNMIQGDRERIVEAIQALDGIDIADVMTSDTHVVNLLSGKNPIGMEVPFEKYISCIEEAVKKALDDAVPAEVGGATGDVDGINVFGSQRISQLASTAGTMVQFMAPVAVLILALAFIITIIVFLAVA